MTCNEAYDVLQISCGASDSEVKAAYRSLMKKFHPDNFSRFDDPEAVRMAEEKSKEINEAYETVSRGRADGSASRPSYGSTTGTRTSHETTTGTRTAHETSAGSRTSHETTTGSHTSHETYAGSRTAYTPPPNPGTRSGPETYSAEQAWTGNAGYDPKRTAAGKQGDAGRMALKYLLNVLLAPLYVLAWPAFAVMNFLTGVLAYVLWGAAGIGFAADCICWFIGKQEFGQFCLILIPIAIGVGLPFLFRLGDDLLESLIDSLHDFLTTPADLW